MDQAEKTKQNRIETLPELLAPAGNYESLIGAMNAGADAVYLAGEKYGARAYASNFTQDELIHAIKYAHLLKKKIYLTLNTLLKNSEIKEIFDFILPFYQAGLDAVIVQDLGVFYLIRQCFPRLEIHISTQMTITGSNGAFLVKELGASRVVPSRELTLVELQSIKRCVPIELETFIHGAMCYSYSGACLFSSLLGGRSGNRGRCAQPCRLPYRVETNSSQQGSETYCLSLKDLCTIDFIPELIANGIDSLKIEGRMKKPEYAAGVTSIYRKYIDRYASNPDAFHVAKEDRSFLEKLYTRSEQHSGYYTMHNSREMITVGKPNYNQVDDTILTDLRNQYLSESKKLPLTAQVTVKSGQPLQCTLFYLDQTILITGAMVLTALKSPVKKEDIIKQFQKTGQSNFYFENLTIEVSDDAFVSLKSLNELRRESLELLEHQLTHSNREQSAESRELFEAFCMPHFKNTKKNLKNTASTNQNKKSSQLLSVSVSSIPQLLEVLQHDFIKKVYLPVDLLLQKDTEFDFEKHLLWNTLINWRGHLFLALPNIIRDTCFGLEDNRFQEMLLKLLSHERVNGYLVKNIDALGFLVKNQCIHPETTKEVVADASFYQFNQLSQELLKSYISTYTTSYELNLAELLQLGVEGMEIPVYGRIPMMVTANCIRTTTTGCDLGKRTDFYDFTKNENTMFLHDRYETKFPVVCDCSHCFNIIYNSVPLSLHGYLQRFERENPAGFRIDFTIEPALEVTEILNYFHTSCCNLSNSKEPPYQNYTKGHLARGVE